MTDVIQDQVRMTPEQAHDYISKCLHAIVGMDLEYNAGAGKRYKIQVDLDNINTRIEYVIAVQRQPDTKLSSLPVMDSEVKENNNGEETNVVTGSGSTTIDSIGT